MNHHETAELEVVRVVGAAIEDAQGRILVAQRGEGRAHAWKWEFPGGKLERGESPEEALVREIREELHLEIEVAEWVGVGMAKIKPQVQVRLDVYRARLVGGELNLEEHAQVKWLVREALGELDWCEADVPIVERMMAKSASVT